MKRVTDIKWMKLFQESTRDFMNFMFTVKYKFLFYLFLFSTCLLHVSCSLLTCQLFTFWFMDFPIRNICSKFSRIYRTCKMGRGHFHLKVFCGLDCICGICPLDGSLLSVNIQGFHVLPVSLQLRHGADKGSWKTDVYGKRVSGGRYEFHNLLPFVSSVFERN